MTETDWQDGYAILRGLDINGARIDATEKVRFKYRLVEYEGDISIDLTHIVHVGPVERSVNAAELTIFNTEADEGCDVQPVAWFQPLPGAGRIGGYVTITPGQEVRL